MSHAVRSGATIGPDLTGSNRSDLNYLLSNVVDPSALIPKEYQPSVIITTSGRLITGIVSAEDDKSVTLRTAAQTIVLPKDEIDDRYLSNMSMMPEGQLTQFSDHEIVSLGAYLMGKSQVPMLATKENEGLLFDGHDFAGWHGDPKLWSVEDGEIVGRSPGLDHNTFLVSDMSANDFRLTFEVKLVNDVGNSGIQFRSKSLNGYEELQGYQADVGPGWWGKLYEENGRELLWDRSDEEHIAKGGMEQIRDSRRRQPHPYMDQWSIVRRFGRHRRKSAGCVRAAAPRGRPHGSPLPQYETGDS